MKPDPSLGLMLHVPEETHVSTATLQPPCSLARWHHLTLLFCGFSLNGSRDKACWLIFHALRGSGGTFSGSACERCWLSCMCCGFAATKPILQCGFCRALLCMMPGCREVLGCWLSCMNTLKCAELQDNNAEILTLDHQPPIASASVCSKIVSPIQPFRGELFHLVMVWP